MSVAVETEGGFRHDTPVRLFEVEFASDYDRGYSLDAVSDGSRFLILEPVEDDTPEDATVTLVQGWRSLLN